MVSDSDLLRLPLAPFAGATVDRVAEIRHDADAISALLTDGPVTAVAASAGRVAVEADGRRLARIDWRGELADAVLLGVQDGTAVLAVDIDGVEDSTDWTDRGGVRPADGVSIMSMRDAGLALDQGEGGLAAYASGLLSWHRRHPFCAVCGHATRYDEGGQSRKCPNCGTSHFPRTDPVVIMAVASDQGLLLGSRVGWGTERYSVLAGFISPGETPEEAVIREVKEESGIDCHRARYAGAQPWPFPASLMLGFFAESDGGHPSPGGDGEMSDVRWFSREELTAMARGESEFVLPPEISIARLLIDAWLEQTPLP